MPEMSPMPSILFGVPIAVVIKAAGFFEDAGELFQIVTAINDAGVEECGGFLVGTARRAVRPVGWASQPYLQTLRRSVPTFGF